MDRAIANKDPYSLEKAIAMYESADGKDDDFVKKAKKWLELLQAKEGKYQMNFRIRNVKFIIAVRHLTLYRRLHHQTGRHLVFFVEVVPLTF
jgi:hypothetical protein